MSTYSGGDQETFLAGAAITRYQVVKVGAADNTVIPAVDDAASMLGVAMRPAASGAQVPVQINRIVKCIASAAVTRGTVVTGAAAGKIATYVDNAGVQDFYLGEALESAAADGDVISVMMMPGTNTGA